MRFSIRLTKPLPFFAKNIFYRTVFSRWLAQNKNPLMVQRVKNGNGNRKTSGQEKTR